ncbi:PepSY-like domain-containing protein [Sphingobacterium faecium]|uniref:PepSY-like domain-containing protein n=1 Tax=Sphingobacterium faecium TaxID=34087 RepID=UPI003208D9D1
MKKLILTFTALLAFAIIVVSCDKDDDHQVPATSLPTSASTFLNTFFKDVTIRKVEKQTPTVTNKTAYSVELANGIEVDFDQEGNWKEVESDNDTAIPTGFISSTIVSYVDTNHKTAQISAIDKVTAGFEVELTNDIDLLFDPSGQFVKIIL